MKTNAQPSLRSLELLPRDLQDQVFSMLQRGQSCAEVLQTLENAGFPGYSRQDLEFYARWGFKSFDFLREIHEPLPTMWTAVAERSGDTALDSLPEPPQPCKSDQLISDQKEALPHPTSATLSICSPPALPLGVPSSGGSVPETCSSNANGLPAIAPKRRGKIARLPKDLRAQLNSMLEDGAAYDDIIQWLADHGHPGVNHVNLHNWKVGGYQDWRRETERLDNQSIQREWLAEQAAHAQPGDLFPILDQLLASQMLDSLFGLDTVTLKQGLAAKPRDYIALANALSRLKRDAMNVPAFQQFLEKERKRAARKPVLPDAHLEYLCARLTGEPLPPPSTVTQPSSAAGSDGVSPAVGRTVPGEPPKAYLSLCKAI